MAGRRRTTGRARPPDPSSGGDGRAWKRSRRAHRCIVTEEREKVRPHPSPLPQERERDHRHHDGGVGRRVGHAIDAAKAFPSSNAISALPLLGGEGWGEGERSHLSSLDHDEKMRPKLPWHRNPSCNAFLSP